MKETVIRSLAQWIFKAYENKNFAVCSKISILIILLIPKFSPKYQKKKSLHGKKIEN